MTRAPGAPHCRRMRFRHELQSVHDWGLPMPDASKDIPACAGCGSCCRLVVELVTGFDDVPEELVAEHDGVRCMDQRGDGACVALDPITRLCTIYERRPKVCRDFKRAETLCRNVVSGAIAVLLKAPGPAS